LVLLGALVGHDGEFPAFILGCPTLESTHGQPNSFDDPSESTGIVAAAFSEHATDDTFWPWRSSNDQRRSNGSNLRRISNHSWGNIIFPVER
jgi:hypothetical protein